MALVNCPECGKEVSSNAKQCVHCGCSFTVCPDCQTVVVGTPQECPRCGCRFSGEAKQKFETVTEDDIIGKFRLRAETDRKRNKIVRFITMGLICVAVILVAVGGLLLELWWENCKSNVALDKLDITLSLKSDFNSVKLTLIFSCVCIVIVLAILEFNEILGIFRHRSVLKYKKEQIPQYVKIIRELAYSEEATAAEYSECLSATHLVYQPEYSNKLIVFAAINVILSVLATIFLTVAVSQNVWEFMLSKVFETKFNFRYVWLIFGAVCLVAAVVFSKVTANKKESDLEAWEKEVLNREK